MDPSSDERFMRRAIELAALGRFTAPPNPAVGAVLVRDGAVAAEAFHSRAGGPHAEARVLRVGAGSRGASLYVNLEPCCHVGRTPPCVERIIASGVARVVAAHPDPDPRVSGGGFARLRAAGIEVRSGVLEPEAVEVNRPFLKYFEAGRPWVTVKAAVSVDGAMAPPGARWITCASSRRHGRVLRREHDAILTGIATVAADDPRLTPRPRSGSGPRLRVVLDPALRTPPSARLLDGAHRDPVLLLAAPGADPGRRRRLEDRGAVVGEVAAGAGAGLSLPAVLAALGKRGARALLVEAGPRLTSAFLREGLADRLVLYVAPDFRGRGEGSGLFDATRRAAGPNRRRPPRSQPAADSVRYARLGRDLLSESLLGSVSDTGSG